MENLEKDASYSHILKYTSLFGGVQGLGILVGIVRNKLAALILGPDGMGLVSLFNSTIKLVSDSTNFGLSLSAVKNLSEAYDAGDEVQVRHVVRLVRSWSLFTALLGMFVCMALSPLLNKWTFTWGDHTLHFILLSPVVGLMAITGGETAILKAVRQLRCLAIITLCCVFLALLCSVPIYYAWGQSGIVPSLVLFAIAQCLSTIAFSFRLYVPSFSLSRKLMDEGGGMVRLGIAFVLAGILGSSAEFVVRSYLNTSGQLVAVGLYNAGYVMTMTYAGMVFSAMETDYFPRLSGIPTLGARLNQVVNHQMEVSLLLVAPLLVLFVVFLPVLLPLLYSGRFLPILGMMKVAVMAMYLRALTLPVEYIALSRSDSHAYLLLEAIYDVLFTVLVIAGYHYLSLWGTGVGLLAASLVNFVVVMSYARWRYHFVASREVKIYALIQIPLGVLAYVETCFFEGWIYWAVGLLLAVLSLSISVCVFHSKSNLWYSLKERLENRLSRRFRPNK